MQNQPVLDTTLKDMLISLRSTIYADMMRKFNTELTAVGDRVDHIEGKMGDYATTINYLIDAQEASDEEQTSIKAKLADLEDRSRRNYMKIKGIPESVHSLDSRPYVTKMFSELLPDLTPIEIEID